MCRPGYGNGRPDRREAPLFDSSGVTKSWEGWLAAQGLALPAHQRVPLGSTYVVSVHAALHGAGLAMAHDTIAADLLASGALVRPCAHGAVMSQAYFLLAPPLHGETPASRAPKEWILDEIEGNGTRSAPELHSPELHSPERPAPEPVEAGGAI